MKMQNMKMTVRMIEALRGCLEQQLADPDIPCTYKISSTMGALYTRQLVDVRAFKIKDEQVMGFYITKKGMALLEGLVKNEI
ncbi:MAG: hypothetical protein ABIQ56_04745 [Chitinophagaceae bacterium]